MNRDPLGIFGVFLVFVFGMSIVLGMSSASETRKSNLDNIRYTSFESGDLNND